MEIPAENLTEKSLEAVTGKNPSAVYSVNFTKVADYNAEQKTVLQKPTANGALREKSGNVEKSEKGEKTFSGKVFRRRNAFVLVAIAAVCVFHFAFQFLFQTQIAEDRSQIEIPAVAEEVRSQPVESEPAAIEPAAIETVELEAKKIDYAPPRVSAPVFKRREPEAAPVAKPPAKKKVSVETRAERLRRVERSLTGV